MESRELDIVRLASKVFGGFWEQSREQLEMWGLRKRSHRIGGAVLANIPKLGRDHPRILTRVHKPMKSVLSYRGSSKDAAPFLFPVGSQVLGLARRSATFLGISAFLGDMVAIPLPQSPAATRALQTASSSPSFCFVEGPCLTGVSLPDPPAQRILY